MSTATAPQRSRQRAPCQLTSGSSALATWCSQPERLQPSETTVSPTNAVCHTVWQAIIRKGATKPRNMPYDKSSLSFHNGAAAVVVDMLQPNKPFIVPLVDVPASSKAVFGQLKHQQCGETAWMRSTEDVKAVFIDQYEAGELADYTKDMTNSTYSLPWPPIADHLTNLAIDKGAPQSSLARARWHLEGVHLQRDAG